MTRTVNEILGKQKCKLAMPFGKYAGEFVEDVALLDEGYLRWFLTRLNPDKNTKLIAEIEFHLGDLND